MSEDNYLYDCRVCGERLYRGFDHTDYDCERECRKHVRELLQKLVEQKPV